MRLILSFLILIICNSVFADEVKVEINPTKPVVNETYQAYFRIFTDSDEEPVINFTPVNTEVVGKSNQGVSTRTVYANGKLSVTREMIIVYELVSSRTGMAGFRDIKVQIGETNLRHQPITYTVLKEPEEKSEIFIKADVSKTNLFIGEGFSVNYYLYHKGNVNNPDIKRYPKLNNFLKRFLNPDGRTERVDIEGQPYLRVQLYAAKLFPEKVGKLKIDPMQLSVAVMVPRRGDPFGNLGFSRDIRTKTVSSEPVTVEVSALPEEGKPDNFTGLVGKHNFDLQMRNSRLIVNEPLEAKLTVSGPGALENLEAPKILSHPDIEEFETNGDLKLMDATQATKVFDYTFIPKSSLTIPPSNLTLSYFDPDTMTYVPVDLSKPEIIVAGGGQSRRKEPTTTNTENPREEKINTPPPVTELAGPIVGQTKSWKEWIPYINFTLAGIALVISLGWIITRKTLPSFSKASIPAQFKKGDFTLSEFTRWISPVIQKTGKSPLAVIKDADLKDETKRYFIDLLNANDYKNYSAREGGDRFVYRPEYFKELGRYIESSKHESPSEST